MDDQLAQFALFTGIAVAFLVLVVVGYEVVRRARALLQQRRDARKGTTVEHEPR